MKLHDFRRKKANGSKITMLTCYDYPSARMVAESKIDCVLVGDSVAMTVHGHATTLMATLDMMVLHTTAVARGINQQFIVSDLPFLCHRESQAHTVNYVRQLMQAGAHAIKIEGGDTDVCHTIAYLVAAGIPVMGHIGLTPQSVLQLGGFRVQGKEETQAQALLAEAQALEAAGCFAIVIECVPQTLAQRITETLTIPTIGIGAGQATDGQVLVWHDILALHTDLKPRFVKQYLAGKELTVAALNAYVQDVQSAAFPLPEHAF